MFDTVKWHDGSNLSVADFVMQMIMTFDQGKKDSPIYDEDAAGNIEAYLTTSRACKIVSDRPAGDRDLDDNFYADAELDAVLRDLVASIWIWRSPLGIHCRWQPWPLRTSRWPGEPVQLTGIRLNGSVSSAVRAWVS